MLRLPRSIGRFDGFVAKYMGDGVLAYFGYPQAHEDDAERAVRAGLAVVEVVRSIANADAAANARRSRYRARGCRRSDRIGCRPGSRRWSAKRRTSPRGCKRWPSRTLSSLPTVHGGWSATCSSIRASARSSSKGCRRRSRLSGCLAKAGSAAGSRRCARARRRSSAATRRLELLQRRWEQAKAGTGRVVLISAEPGIGKSRLAEAFRESIAGEPHTRLRYFCSPHRQDSALFPFIGQLERAAGFERDDTPAARLDKLEALVAANGAGGRRRAIAGRTAGRAAGQPLPGS